MAIIRVNDLSFTYPGSYDAVFEHVTLTLDTRWRLGLIGRNGRGKTTFLKLLMGEFVYQGEISSSTGFSCFPFSVANPRASAAQVMQDICPIAELWELQREASLLEVEEEALERPFCTLSFGEQTKVLLAALFLREDEFLLLDEPTNHLDAPSRIVLGRYLRGKQGFLLVSHDRQLLDSCIDHVLAINRSDIVLQQGNCSTWKENTMRLEAFERGEQERLARDIRRLEESAKQRAGWAEQQEKSKNATRNSGLRPDRGYIGHKSAKMMKRVKSAQARQEAAIAKKAQLLTNVETAEPLRFQSLPWRGRQMLELRDVAISYGERQVCEPVSFQIYAGERLALCGKNGSGKTSLLRLVLGEDIPHSGTVRLASGLRVSYVPQDASFLSGSLEAYLQSCGVDGTLLRTILRKLGLERVQFSKDIRALSEGQKKKVLVAKSLCERAHLYLWDEPLNYMDVIAREQIEDAVVQSCPAMLFVEHDDVFADRAATGRVVL